MRRMYCFLLFVFMIASALYAQSSDVPHLIGYQGQIKGTSGVPLSGDHLLTVTIYSDEEGANQLWQGEYTTKIDGGVFNITLGSDSYPLPNSDSLNRQLYIGVKVDNGAEMRPLTMITGAPFALTVPDKSITKEKIGTDYVGAIALNGQKITQIGTTLNLRSGLGLALDFDKSSNTLSLNALGNLGGGRPQTGTLFSDITTATNTTATMTVGSGASLLTSGTGTITSNQFVGSGSTSNAVDLATAEVNGILPVTNGGTGSNSINFWNIGGNTGTTAGTNFIGTTDVQPFEIHVENAGSGGDDGIGRVMKFEPNATSPKITGGYYGNYITGAYGSVICGGGAGAEVNYIIDDGDYLSHYSIIGGGRQSEIIGSADAVVCGGLTNVMNESAGSFIGGGANGTITTSVYAFIGGGSQNKIFGGQGDYSAIVGGYTNHISAAGIYSFIGGGNTNLIGNDDYTSTSINYDVIIGGDHNNIKKNINHSIIAGGQRNIIFDGYGSTPLENSVIAGGQYNYVDATLSIIGGGISDTIHTEYSFIGGGSSNIISSNCGYSVISGGHNNYIGPDINNAGGLAAFNVIAGGQGDTIRSGECSVLGGEGLTASSFGQTVIGNFNLPRGSSYVQPAPPVSHLVPSDPVFVIGNGTSTSLANRSNAFEVSRNGHSIVYHSNGSGGATTGPGNATIGGATYEDNIIYAWAIIPTEPVWAVSRTIIPINDFGILNITENPAGTFTFTMNATNPDGTPKTFTNCAVVATLSSTSCLDHIVATPVSSGNTFTVVTSQITQAADKTINCGGATLPFMVIVTGR